MCKNWLIISILILLTGTLQAQEQSVQDTIPLQEVTVVSGTKTSVNRNLVPATISVVTREELDASAESAILPILSERIPGLFVTERGITGFGVATGAAGTVNIHGIGGGNKVLMLFDGQPQWAGIFGHHIPDTYVASDAQQVEVLRGPASLLYGSNAMGGAINIITRKANQNGLHGNGRILFGSYNTQKYMANGSLKKDKFNAYLSLNHDRTDGQRDHSDFHITNGFLKLGYDLSKEWNISSNTILAKFKTTNPGPVNTPLYDSWADVLRGTYSISVENHYEKISGAIQGFYNTGLHEVNYGHTPEQAPLPCIFHSNDFNAGVTAYESFHLFSDNLITTGIDFKSWGGHAWNDSIDNKPDFDLIDRKVNELAVYALSQQTFCNKFTVNAGVRLEMNEEYGNEWVPQAGISYAITKNSILKTTLSKGFRSPNIRELYMNNMANPDLKPEYMYNYDISYLQDLMDGKIHFELTAYLAEGKNMIVTTIVDKRPKNINSGEFLNRGIDFSMVYRLLPTLKLSGNYSFLDMDTPLAGAPQHQAFMNINWKIDRVSLSSGFQYVGGLYTLVEPKPVKEYYGLLGAQASYRATQWASVFINGENLTHTDYEINYGFPMPGMVVMAGVDLKF